MGNSALEMVSHLRALGHDMAVYTPMYTESGEVEEDLPEELKEEIDYAERLKPTISFGNAARMPQIQKALDQFDLVHLHYPFYGTANLVRRWKLRNPDKPLVITYHMDTRGPGWKGAIFKLYTKFWMPKILDSADLIIGSSFDYIQSSLAGEIYKSNPKKWTELPFGVDIDRFKVREQQDALFARHDLDPSKPTILFVGGMDAAHYFKGIPVLLKALLVAKRSGFEIQAVFVGDGELREGFELRAKGYRLGKLVRFVGKVSHGELPYHYNMANLTVLPSVHMGEAFGMVLLESMASGTPVIASDLPGVRTVAEKGGFVFPSNDHRQLAQTMIDYFSLEPEERGAWNEKVRQNAELEYSWEEIVGRLNDLYSSLVSL
ncbi:MAG: glycosyltransferase family 4 protein [Candidatus Magasanikbacteria bacterium]